MLETVEERTLVELEEGHRCLHRDLAQEMEQLDLEVFFAPQGEFWSPAGHIDHLVRSVRPLAGALRLPRIALWWRFGRSSASRPTEQVVERYLDLLSQGKGARGQYLPEPVAAGADPTEEARQQLLGRYRAVGEALIGALGRWNERSVDRYRLPHPLLGLLTVRELLAWSLYHGRHHRRRIHDRAAAESETK